MKKRIITRHAKKRMKERANRNKNYKSFGKLALNKGKTMQQFEPEFYRYLSQKSNGRIRIKVYENYIYLTSKSKRTLITMYKVPDRFLPVKEHTLLNSQSILFYHIECLLQKKVKIKMKNGIPVYGRIVDAEFFEDNITENVIVKTTNNIKLVINAKDIKLIQKDTTAITTDLYEMLVK